MTVWVTLADIGTAAGTLVLAGACGPAESYAISGSGLMFLP
jgi:hypothetical protein